MAEGVIAIPPAYRTSNTRLASALMSGAPIPRELRLDISTTWSINKGNPIQQEAELSESVPGSTHHN